MTELKTKLAQTDILNRLRRAYSITAPSALSLSGTPTAVKCKDGDDGKVDVTVDGGTAPYSYVWVALGFNGGGDGTANVTDC